MYLKGRKRTTEICRGSRDPLKVSQYRGGAQLTAQGCRMDRDQSDSFPHSSFMCCSNSKSNTTNETAEFMFFKYKQEKEIHNSSS